MNVRPHHILLTLGLLIAGPLSGQYFPSKQYMTADGMPSNSVFDIAQHSSGMMWFVTKAGPTYYDAKKWHSFPDSLELPSSNNSKIIALDSIIWVAGLNKTAFTVQYFNGIWNSLEVPFAADDFKRHIAFNVKKVNDQYQIFVGANRKLFIYDTDLAKWNTTQITADIYSIQTLKDQVFISTSDGLWNYQKDSLVKVHLPYGRLPSNDILIIAKANERLHLLGYNWYAEIENDSVVFLLNDAGLTSSSTFNQSSLVVDKTGRVFFGSATPARLIDHKNKTWNNLLIKGENLNIGSTSLFSDRENNLWVSDSRGLFKFNVLQFQNYNRSSGLASDEVSAITQLSNGSMVLANPFEFNILQNGVIQQCSDPFEKTLTYRILAIDEDTTKQLVYMATNDQGLVAYDIGAYDRPRRMFPDDQLTFTSVKTFKGITYAAGISGIYAIDGDRSYKINSNGRIRNICVLGDRLAFLSNANGIFTFDGVSFKNYTSPNFDLSSVYQTCIYNGDTLVATRDGVGVIQGDEIIHWEKLKQRTPAYGLLVDRQNRLWVGGDNGIYLYDGVDLEFFNTEEGLSGNEINRNALFEDADGQIWIGTEKGVSVFNGTNRSFQNLNLAVNITAIVTDKRLEIEASKPLELPYDENSFQIEFQCLSYVDESKINFRYRINPSSDWIQKREAGNDIVFSNLKSGDYAFEIQARLGNRAWGPSSSFDFTIKKPFYDTWWFIALMILLAVLVARTIFYFRYLYLIRKQRKLKEEVALRTKEITLLNEQLERKVQERTKELNDKNKRLEESAYANAHYLRGPLTKIMSAMHVLEHHQDHEFDTKLIGILKESVDELDEVIHSINNILKEQDNLSKTGK